MLIIDQDDKGVKVSSTRGGPILLGFSIEDLESLAAGVECGSSNYFIL